MKCLEKLCKAYREMRISYREGYDAAREIDELITLYGRENFINKNVEEKDKERLEIVTNRLRHMYGEGTSFFMLWGFQQYRNKTVWKRLKKVGNRRKEV